MKELTPLDRGMLAESVLLEHCYVTKGEYELYDMGDSCAIDLIANLCHLLHLDEKTAGCLSIERVRGLLDTAFNHFETETAEGA